MSNFLNRTTLDYRTSVNDPDFPDPPWLLIPPASANATIIATVPAEYWILEGDVLREADAAEKAIIDQAILDASRDDEIQIQVDDIERTLRQLAKLMVDEINILRQQFNTTTAESNQLTTTSFADRTLAQVRNQLRNTLGT